MKLQGSESSASRNMLGVEAERLVRVRANA